MPYLIALFGIIIGAFIWINRARSAAQASHELIGVAQDVMAAARRFGFRRKLDLHPVESVDDPDIAVAGAGIAFLELGGLPTAEQQDRLIVSLQAQLGQSRARAEEAPILGRWLMTESGGAQQGLDRLTRRLYKLRGGEAFHPLMADLKDVAASSRNGGLSQQQRDAIAEVAVLFRIN